MPLAAVEIRLRSFRGDVDDAALLVERLAAPRHEAGHGFVSVRRPGVVALLARSRDQVKDPAPLAGARVEGPHRAGSAEAADDEEILVDDARRVQAEGRRRWRVETGAEMERAFFGEALDREPGLRIERVE